MSEIFISEEEWEEVFNSFKKQKIIVSRPCNTSIQKNEGVWKISLTFNSSAYPKSSTYTALKPLWKFIKEKILSIDPSPSITWEILRVR